MVPVNLKPGSTICSPQAWRSTSVQRWRPSADTVFFYEKNYFVVVKWQQAERAALQSFVREIQNGLNPQGSDGR